MECVCILNNFLQMIILIFFFSVNSHSLTVGFFCRNREGVLALGISGGKKAKGCKES